MKQGKKRKRKLWAGLFCVMLLTILTCIPAAALTRLGETEKAYWDKSETGVAHWKKVDHAKEYQVRLYISGGEHVKSLTVTGTKADFSSYMKNDAAYYFSVRAVPKSNQKDYASGEWVTSEDLEVHDLGDTEGRWRTYTQGKKYQKEDKSYVTGQWYQVRNDWYYFNQDGFLLTGWQQIDSKWYYLGEDGIMKTGWLDLDGSRYFLDSDGSMAIGWKQVKPGEWYYMDSQGKMLANTEVDGYKLNESGMWIQ